MIGNVKIKLMSRLLSSVVFVGLKSIEAVDELLSLVDQLSRGTGNTLVSTLTLGHNNFKLDQEVTFWCFLP